MGTKGSVHLYDMLKQNNTLTHLVLQGNDFDDSSAEVWADIILVRESLSIKLSKNILIFCFENTNRLEYLDLSHNNFGELAGKLLGPAISENTSLKTLILSWNNLRSRGAIALAKGLQVVYKNFTRLVNNLQTYC